MKPALTMSLCLALALAFGAIGAIWMEFEDSEEFKVKSEELGNRVPSLSQRP